MTNEVGRSDDALHVAWFVRSKRRWAAAGLVWLGTGLWLWISVLGLMTTRSYQALVGLGHHQVAQKENAAVVWRRAHGKTVAWKGSNSDNPETGSVDWSDPGVFTAGGSVLLHLEANREALELADQAARFKKCDWELDYLKGLYLILPHLPEMRRMARLCKLRAAISGRHGDWDGVLKSIRTCMGCSRHLRDDYLIIGYLVQVTVDAICMDAVQASLSASFGCPPAGFSSGLSEMVEEHLAAFPKLSRSLATERIFGEATFDRQVWDTDVTSTRPPSSSFPPFPKGLNRVSPLYVFDRPTYTYTLKKAINRAKALEQWGPPGRDQNPMAEDRLPEVAPLSKMMIPVLERTYDTARQHRMRWRLVQAAMAVLDFRRDHGGAWPQRLEDVDHGADRLKDLCDPGSRPIRYRIELDGSACLWSVGRDGKDDGGVGEKVKDLVFRLPSRKAGERTEP